MERIIATGGKGLFGMASSWLSYVVASVSSATEWLRMCSIGVGLLVAILTGVSILFDIRRKYREQNKRRNV